MGCHFLLQRMKVGSESEVIQSCPTLSDPMDCSPPGSSVHGIFQAKMECLVYPKTPNWKTKPWSRRLLHTPKASKYTESMDREAWWAAVHMVARSWNMTDVTSAAAAKSLQSCPTLCDPIDGCPPGFPFPGILQARILEWVAISFSDA